MPLLAGLLDDAWLDRRALPALLSRTAPAQARFLIGAAATMLFQDHRSLTLQL